MNKTEISTVAIHEAGHAWMFCQEDVRFISISIESKNDCLGGVTPDHEQPRDKGPIAYLRILLSGAASEIAMLPLPSPKTLDELNQMMNDNAGWQDDFWKAIGESYAYHKLGLTTQLDHNGFNLEDINNEAAQTILSILHECIGTFKDSAVQLWVNKLADLLTNKRTMRTLEQELLNLIEEHQKLY